MSVFAGCQVGVVCVAGMSVFVGCVGGEVWR